MKNSFEKQRLAFMACFLLLSPSSILGDHMKKTLLAACMTATFVFAQGAFATPLSLNASLAPGYLSNGAHAGVFDATAALPAHYQINSASFYFSFSDDSDPVWGYFQSLGTSYTPYTHTSTVYNASDDYYYYYNVRSVTANSAFQMFGEAERASLSLGGQVIGSGATSSSTSTSQATSFQYEILDKSYDFPRYGYVCGDYNICIVPGSTQYYYSDYYATTTTFSSDYTGNFMIQGALTDQTVLDQLLNSGLLSINLGVTGDLNLTAARLDLDYTALDSPPQGAVPEPSSLLLSLTALGGVIGLRRKRRAAPGTRVI
jgi:hypothetical protein